ncbi:hypothetical protein [Vulgatibacter incomptus]|nr:hypothetical protein [Vulgatibacter incomptus]
MNIPLLDLKTPSGAPAPWKDLWQKRNVLLLIGDEECAPCRKVLDAWAGLGDELRSEHAAALAIFPRDPGGVADGIVLLEDPDGRMAEALGARPGTIVAADRYFEIQQCESLHDRDVDEVVRDTLEWIDLAERTCDECGVSTW